MTATKTVLLLGGSGAVGSAILAELVGRGHRVVAGVRPGGRSPATPDGTTVGAVEVDPRSAASIAAAADGTDAIISAIGGRATGDFSLVADAAPALLAATSIAGVARLLVIGGAGSLFVAGGIRRVDEPAFPDAWRRSSLPQAEALALYRADRSGVDWVYLSPSDLIEPGGPTGDVEIGTDHLLRGPDGASSVTEGDLAAVLVDELDDPTRHRERFTARTR